MSDAYRRLTVNQYLSLQAAARLLEAKVEGERMHIPGNGLFDFNMGIVRRKLDNDCGTVGCILGLANEIEVAAGHANTWQRSSGQGDLWIHGVAEALFFPRWRSPSSYDLVTAKDAAMAIHLFLLGVDEPWKVPELAPLIWK